MRLPLAPFKVWPQLALVWDPSCTPVGITNQMGFFSISLGPLAIEIDGREYVKWMTGVILPEARSVVDLPPGTEYGITDGEVWVEYPTTGYVHPDTCVCLKD